MTDFTREVHTGDASASASAFIADGSRLTEADVAPWLAQMALSALPLRLHHDVVGLTLTVRWRPYEAVEAANADKPEVA